MTKLIEAYGLLDYSLALEAAIKEGYSVDISTNEHAPTSYGGYLTATLVLNSGEAIKVVAPEETKVEPVADKTEKTETRGRKAKS